MCLNVTRTVLAWYCNHCIITRVLTLDRRQLLGCLAFPSSESRENIDPAASRLFCDANQRVPLLQQNKLQGFYVLCQCVTFYLMFIMSLATLVVYFAIIKSMHAVAGK